MNVLLLLIVLSAINGQFLEQPDAGTVFAPVQNKVTLICSVEEGHHIDWRVTFASEEVAYASSVFFRMQLMRQQFTLEGVDTNRSTLSLRETVNQTNNGTNITCIAQEKGTIMSTTGSTVQVIFYGAPPPPTDLSVTDDELGSLNISWSLGFIEGVPVNYTLIVLNLNTTSAQPIIIAGLLDQHYVLEASRPCDVYSFTVTAVTAAGNSTPSQEFVLNVCIATMPFSQTSTTKSPVPPSKAAHPEGPGAGIYVGATAGAFIIAILIGIILYCVCKQTGKKSRCCITCLKSQLQQVEVTGTNQEKVQDLEKEAIEQLYARLNFSNQAQKVAKVAQHSQYTEIDKDTTSDTETSESNEADMHSGNSNRILKIDSPDASKYIPDPSYAQVDIGETVMVDNSQAREDLIDPLYTQVDGSETKADIHYSQVDKSKTRSKVSKADPGIEARRNALYSQVDKSKSRTTTSKDEKSQSGGALYSQVNKSKKVKKESVKEPYAQVNKRKGKTMAKRSEERDEILYANVRSERKRQAVFSGIVKELEDSFMVKKATDS